MNRDPGRDAQPSPADAAAAVTCLACGSVEATPWAVAQDVEYVTSADSFSFYRCSRCDVLFISPPPVDRLAEIYPPNYYSYGTAHRSPVFAIKEALDRRLFRRVLSQIPGDALAVLDVGGGAGEQVGTVRATDARIRHTQIVDLDPNAEALARASGHAYFCGRIEDFQGDRSFDLVLLLNLIEHVDDPALVLGKVRELLSPGGLVLVKTPNYDAWDARIFRHHSWAGYHCPRHWVLFTKDSFTALAAKQGLIVRQFSYTQGAPFWAASVLFWLARRGLVSITRERPVFYHRLFGLLSAAFAGVDFLRRPFAKTSQMFFVLGRQQ